MPCDPQANIDWNAPRLCAALGRAAPLDMQQALPWIIALAVLVVIAAAMALWVTRPRQAANVPLPADWTVVPRAVFSVDERRAYRQLREAFPQYIVLAKLPLIRFCQPADAKEMHYWFELLGSIHVSFAVCSAHGRVLATIDLDGERPPARRTQQIKQSVLSACRVRYLRCAIEHLPTTHELQMLLPQSPAAAMPPAAHRGGSGLGAPQVDFGRTSAHGASAQTQRRDVHDTVPAPLSADRPAPVVRRVPITKPSFEPTPAAAVATSQTSRADQAAHPADARHRKERKALWQDSGLFQDSFFGIDNLRDAGPQSSLGPLLGESARGRNPAAGQTDASMLESERMKSQKKPS